MSMSVGAVALGAFSRSVSAAPAGSPAANSEADKTAADKLLQTDRLAELQAKFREKVMRQRNLSDDVIAKMSASDQAAIRTRIEREAAEQMRASALAGAADGTGQDLPSRGAVIDVRA